jgi:hypothetical protein
MNMWKILLILALLLSGGILIFQKQLRVTYELHHFKDRTLPIKFKGALPKIEKSEADLKSQICSNAFPLKIYSEVPVPEPLDETSGICVANYRGERIGLINKTEGLKETEGFFRSLGGHYSEMTFFKRGQLLMEIQRPQPDFFFVSAEDVPKVLIYMLRIFGIDNKEATEIEKYISGDKVVYRTLRIPKSKRLDVVTVLANDYLVECHGRYCVEYFRELGII